MGEGETMDLVPLEFGEMWPFILTLHAGGQAKWGTFRGWPYQYRPRRETTSPLPRLLHMAKFDIGDPQAGWQAWVSWESGDQAIPRCGQYHRPAAAGHT